MLRFLLTPRWIAAHTAFALAIAFCAVAGWWQFGVYDESNTRHTDRDREPVAMSALVNAGDDIGNAADRPVSAEGRYLDADQRLVPGRIHQGVLGWFVLSPLETSDGTVLPVVRGWVEEMADVNPPPSGEVSVTGHLLPAEIPDHATVRSGQVLANDELAYISPESIADATGISADESVHGYLLMSSETPTATGVAVLDVDEVSPIRNVNPWQNLSYWAQWWVFGIAAVIFWASAVRAGVRSRRTPPDDGSAGDIATDVDPGIGPNPGDAVPVSGAHALSPAHDGAAGAPDSAQADDASRTGRDGGRADLRTSPGGRTRPRRLTRPGALSGPVTPHGPS